MLKCRFNVDLTVMAQCRSAAFTELSEQGSSTFLCFKLLQGRRVKQWPWGVFIRKKITGSRHGIAVTSKSRYPCQTMSLLLLLLDYILPSGMQRKLLSIGEMNRKMEPCVLQRWICDKVQNLSFILISWLDLCKNEDNDFEKYHHKCVSLFCCIFFLRLKTWHIQSILLRPLHCRLVNCRSKRKSAWFIMYGALENYKKQKRRQVIQPLTNGLQRWGNETKCSKNANKNQLMNSSVCLHYRINKKYMNSGSQKFKAKKRGVNSNLSHP